MKPILAVDMDEVLADSIGLVLELYSILYCIKKGHPIG